MTGKKHGLLVLIALACSFTFLTQLGLTGLGTALLTVGWDLLQQLGIKKVSPST